MAYRSDLDALEARYHALQAELAVHVRARDVAAALLADARAHAEQERIAADLLAGGPSRRRRQRVWTGVAVCAVMGMLGLGIRIATHHRRHSTEALVHQLAVFADAACACGDATCADRVTDDMTRWAMKLSASRLSDDDRDNHLDRGTLQRVTDLVERYTDCIATAHQ